MFASVMIDLKTTQIEPLYDYIIPQKLKGFLKVGMRVVVPFGNLTRAALVVKLHDDPSYATKEIIHSLDIEPTVSKSQLLLVDYLENKMFMPKQFAFSLVVPLALQMKYQKRIVVINREKIGKLSSLLKTDVMMLDDMLYEYITQLKKAADMGYIQIEDVLTSKAKIQQEPYYRFKKNQARMTQNRQAIIDYLSDNSVSLSELLNQGFTKNSLNSMVKSDILIVEFKEKLKKTDLFFSKPYQPKSLTIAQSNAITTIEKAMNRYGRFLLHGVTASGKTEVFLMARRTLEANKQLLILVPEISQVYQLAASFSDIFDDIYMIHSNLSLQERYDTWRQIKNGKAKVIIATKHGVFLPFKSLGMIIIDEAHDSNYIQTSMPRFDAIELSQVLANKENIPFILSTATPTIEQYYDASMGKMSYLPLDKKIHQTKHHTHIIDMKQELIEGNKDMFSTKLKTAISQLKASEQAMILLNRRGYAPFMMCRECGFVPTCDLCHTSMVYHKHKDTLICHHCGIKKPLFNTCPSCHSQKIKTVGIGVEQVEESLKKLYPTKRISRLDSDSTSSVQTEVILKQFKDKEIDILVGTQIVAKGHDFDCKVSAVLLADMGLKLSSYLANEYTYNLIKQMQGRSGRFNDGITIVQTYDTSHFIFKILDKPYEVFYEQELRNRQLSNYPPFSKLVYITCSHKSDNVLIQTLTKIKHDIIKQHSQYTVLGPSESFIPYKQGKFYYHLLLKVPKRTDFTYMINQIKNRYEKICSIDINMFDTFI